MDDASRTDSSAARGERERGGQPLIWTAVDRSEWRVEFPPGRIILRSGDQVIDLPQDRWTTDLYVASHGDAYILRVETFRCSVGFLLTPTQVEPFFRHTALAPTPHEGLAQEEPAKDAPLLWPRISPMAVWAVVCAALSFLPILGIVPAIASVVLVGLHHHRVRRAPAWRHSRWLCGVAALMTVCGTAVFVLGTWGLIENVSHTRKAADPARFERSPGQRDPARSSTRVDRSSASHDSLHSDRRTGGPESAALSASARAEARGSQGCGTMARGSQGRGTVSPPRAFSEPYHAGVLDEDHDWGLIAAALFVVLLSLTVHEAAHATSAWWLGDDFARRLGRVTLNPVAHVDPIGTLLLPLILFLANVGAFGWAKPVPVRLDHVRRPRRAHILIAFAGPGSNLLLACAALMLLLGIGCGLGRLVPEADIENLVDPNFHLGVAASGFLLAPVVGPLCTILKLIFLINVMLAFFNLIPVPPLDGSWILENLFPLSLGPIYQRIRPMSFLLFLGLMYTDVLAHLMAPAWYVVDFGFALLALCTIY